MKLVKRLGILACIAFIICSITLLSNSKYTAKPYSYSQNQVLICDGEIFPPPPIHIAPNIYI